MAYCTPFGYRVARRSAASPAAHFFPAALQADLSPFLRAFDELENHLSAAATGSRHAIRSFQPRFDVREEKDAYHLQGELPGVSQDNISIEFTDRTTLVVRGQTVRERQAGNPSVTAEEHKAVEDSAAAEATEPAAEIERAATPTSDDGSNYHQPTVEEDREEGWTEAVPTPATTATEVAKPAEQQQQVEKTPEQKPAKEQGHYWVNERSVGSFQRVFNFSNPVDQEAVTANLKDGILSVVVPKEQPKQPRKITIQ